MSKKIENFYYYKELKEVQDKILEDKYTFHREDGPAFIQLTNGVISEEEWYQENELHRLDGPACISYENGVKTFEGWYKKGEAHRENGPAIIYYDNEENVTDKFWWLEGSRVSN